MSKFRFSLDGGDITAINPDTWEDLQKVIAKALEEAGSDGLRVTGFQMPDESIDTVFGTESGSLSDRILYSDQVDGP